MLRSLSFILILSLAWCAPASAIQRSEEGSGQYLIAPFALAAGAHETLIEISNASSDAPARALKLRVLDRDGQPRLLANLYLPSRATWAAGLTGDEGMARVVTSSPACLLVEGDGGIEAASEIDFDFAAGSLEVVEMGVAVEEPLASNIEEGACTAIVDLWSDEGWSADDALSPPTGELRLGVRIINVAKGTMYGVPVTALTRFSDIVQHRPPGSAQPNLASTHDSGTAAGQTRSVVCWDNRCAHDFWERPIDAASAALLTYTARDTYEISDSLAAESEWVVTYPTMAYYDEDEHWGSSQVSLLVADRNGEVIHGGYVYIPELPPVFGETTIWLFHERSVNLINFRMADRFADEPISLGIFGLETALRFMDRSFESLPDSGQARLGFDSGAPTFTEFIEASSGRRYYGRPAIVATFTEYTNGVLPGEGGLPQRANYGSSGEVTTTVRIDGP